MARLPIPDQDDGTWGNILNDYLGVEHNPDGSLKLRTDPALTNKYTKPASGIPKADLSSSVQTSLDNADNAIPKSVVTTKGDLLAATAANTVSRVGLGVDGQVLTADATQAIGVKWGAVPAGATGSQGPPGLVWRGAWSLSNTYAIADAVSHQGSSYIALASSTGVTPGTDGTKWDLLVAQGAASVGAAGTISPADMGFKGWTFDSVLSRGDSGTTFQGQLYGSKLSLPASTVSTVHFRVPTAGTNLTSGQNFVCLYDTSGNLVAKTADQTTAFQTIGLQSAAFTTTPTIVAATYYAAFLCNMPGAGATLPTFSSLLAAFSVQPFITSLIFERFNSAQNPGGRILQGMLKNWFEAKRAAIIDLLVEVRHRAAT